MHPSVVSMFDLTGRRALVTGGNFEGRFVVPLESLPGARGKVRAYVQGLPGAAPIQDGVGRPE